MIGKAGKAIGEAAEAASLYTKAEADHFKLRLAKAITVWSSRLISGLVVMLSVVLILIFLGLSAALYLQRDFSPEAAYLIVGGAYALLALIFLVFRKVLVEPFILKSTLNEMFDES
ncbi:MAG: hypothetical protein ABR572_08725 [Cryomorphaceae bacterium]